MAKVALLDFAGGQEYNNWAIDAEVNNLHRVTLFAIQVSAVDQSPTIDLARVDLGWDFPVLRWLTRHGPWQE